MRIFLIAICGMCISFIGAIPLGTLNITAMQIGIYQNTMQAFLFSLGAVIIELGYVAITLYGTSLLKDKTDWFITFSWIAFVVMLGMGFFHLFTGLMSDDHHDLIFSKSEGMTNLGLGMFLSAINPVQIPFWLGWNMVLTEKKLLHYKGLNPVFYVFGIGLGTMLGNTVFILGGKYGQTWIMQNSPFFSLTIGIVFLLTACWQYFQIRKKSQKQK